MHRIEIQNLLDLDRTIAKSFFVGKTYPWEVLTEIGDSIIELGKTLDLEKFHHPAENIWIAKSANVFSSAYIDGPCIIDEDAQIRHCAYIRGNAIIGKGAVVGNSTELKNSVLFDAVQAPHYNYVGDSVFGYKSHTGAGAITSNVKADKKLTTLMWAGEKIETGLKKFGAILGDFAEIGSNTIMNPATIVGRNAVVYPLSMVRGVVPENSIYKCKNEIVEKREV